MRGAWAAAPSDTDTASHRGRGSSRTPRATRGAHGASRRRGRQSPRPPEARRGQELPLPRSAFAGLRDFSGRRALTGRARYCHASGLAELPGSRAAARPRHEEVTYEGTYFGHFGLYGRHDSWFDRSPMPRVYPSTVLLLLAGILSAAPAHAKAFNRPHMHHPQKGCQISVGPITVERGTELTECTYLKFPSKQDM